MFDKIYGFLKEIKLDNSKVHILEVRRTDIPPLISDCHDIKLLPEIKVMGCMNPPIPKEVRKILLKTGENAILYKGIVYKESKTSINIDGVKLYEVSKDITRIVNPVLKLPEIRKTISELEQLTECVLPLKMMATLPGFNITLIRKDRKYGDLALGFYESEEQKDEIRSAHLTLSGGWTIFGPYIFQDLAVMSYKRV